MKRFLPLLMAALLVLGLFPVSAGAISGAGTAQSPYIITSKTDLNNVRNHLSACYRLGANITFSAADFASGGAFYNGGKGFIPIGTTDAPFTGSFDGDNHTIKGLKQVVNAELETGLFAYVENGTIKNLKMEGGSVMVDVTNILADVFTGGIVGWLYTTGNIINCTYNGSINTSILGWAALDYTGGIVGRASGTVKDCTNLGTITGNCTNRVYVGGIAGYAEGNEISGCTNKGKVTSDGNLNYAGGIAGATANNKGATPKISRCGNSGAVSGNTSGGIAGNTYNTMVEHCVNTGSIQGIWGAAGISEYHENGSVIQYCYNSGGITAERASGIAVTVKTSSEIKYCYNSGAITGKAPSVSTVTDLCAGGIAACLEDNNAMYDCFNAGSISIIPNVSGTKYCGGIVGSTNSDSKNLMRCYNAGSVATGSGWLCGGICGKVDYAPQVTNCYYLDNIVQGSQGQNCGKKLTQAQMKQQASFTGFDFTNIWTMAGSASYLYPELKALPMVTIQYTVTFNSQSGSSVAAKKVNAGSTVSAPGNPARTGYTFGGWYKEAACVNKWNFATDKVTKSITLYAKWTAAFYKPVVKAASAGYNSTKISWNKVTGAAGYEIWRAASKAGKYSKIYTAKSGSTVSYKNTGLTAGKTYYYRVRAYRKASGKTVYTDYSDIKYAKPVPATPGGVKAVKASATSVKISWGKVSGASGYEIYYNTAKTGTYKNLTTINKGTTASYTKTGLAKGKTYYFEVRAYRTVSGKKVYGSFSAIVSAKL
jgi:uncharacterized repeat protein (TIGR02543 family)